MTRRTRLILGLLFTTALAVWTWKLLEPRPVPESVMDGLRSFSDLLPFLAAKTLHAGGYAFLAFVGWWAVPPQWRPVIIGGLLAHGVVSEILQYLLPFNRTGRVADVVIDWLGIAIGTVVAYRTSRRLISRTNP